MFSLDTTNDPVEIYRTNFPDAYARLIANGNTVTGILPEDREQMQPCPYCGCIRFIFASRYRPIVGDIFTFARCVHCGRPARMSAKRMDVKDARNSNRNSSWKEKIRERYGNHCALCEETKDLCVHHIIPWIVDETLRFSMNNGILLCRKHHKLAHTSFGGFRNYRKKQQRKSSEGLGIGG
mgnify:CR=1 FL=1